MTKRGLAMRRPLPQNNAMAFAPSDHDPYYAVLARAAASPSLYKVCTVCGNIVEMEASECIYCCAYRFETDAEFVSNTALDQATHTRSSVTDASAYAED